MPAAARAVVSQHQHRGGHAKPFVIGGKHLGKFKPRLTAQLQVHQHKIPQKAVQRPHSYLCFAVVPQQIQQHAANQVAPTTVRDAGPHGHRAGDDKRQHGADNRPLHKLREHSQHCSKQVRPADHCRDSGNALPILFGAHPVDALPDHTEQNKILEDRVLRVKVIPAAERLGIDHEKLHRRHARTDAPDTEEIPLAVMRMGKAFHRAEQKQRCRQARQHAEPFRDASGKLKKVVDMIHQHQYQRNGFERRAGQTFVCCLQHLIILLMFATHSVYG